MHFSVLRPSPTVISKMGMRRVRNSPDVRTSAITLAISPGRSSLIPARIQPVFIAKRQVVQQVLDRRDALLQQHRRVARSDALHILDVGGKIKHSAMVNQPSALSR